jgi:hypothetical protein
MSKRIITLRQILQDLESRYGKSDPDVQKLQDELIALVAIKEKYRQKRGTGQNFAHGFQEARQRR